MSRISMLACSLLILSPLSMASDNIIRTSAPIHYSEKHSMPSEVVWVSADSVYGEWVNHGYPDNCSAWAPGTDSADIGTTLTQTSNCGQAQVRSVQPREQQQGTQVYRNSGSAYEETQVIAVSNQRDVSGTAARSCLMLKQYAGATANGVYTLRLNGRDVSVMCDMTGGGWTVVGRGYQNSVLGWATTRDAINVAAIPGQLSTVTAKLADDDINAIQKTAYKVVTTGGYANARYFKGSCVYNNIDVAAGDCAISYADENWTSPRGNGLSGAGGAGLCDSTTTAGGGYFILTSARKATAQGWAAGSGVSSSTIGTAVSAPLVSQYIYVR